MYKCPIEESYSFTDSCMVETCKNYTLSTRDRCLSLNCEDTSIVSDNEIKYFKRMRSLNHVSLVRKKAEARIMKLIVLDKYIDLCEEHAQVDLSHPTLSLWLSRFPINTGLWPNIGRKVRYVFSLNRYDVFRKRLSVKTNYTLYELLGTSKKEFFRIINEIHTW